MLSLLSGAVLFGLISCDGQRPVKECVTFAEMADPTDDVSSDWSTVSKGLQASWVDITEKYAKSVNPEITVSKEMQLTGWKGERVSAQLLLWSAEEVQQVECELSDLKSGSSVISAEATQARFVRYVMTDEFASGCGHRKPEDFAASLAPDMLDNIECMNVEAKTVRPVWITVDIPASAAAGLYKGKVKVYGRGQSTQTFNLVVDVVDQTLPPASEWAYHLDLWQHPSAVARVHNLELWSDAHFETMKPLMQILANAGQKVITATLNKDPWNNQCFDAYEDMILWTKHADGTWSYDYTIFDKWVQFMMDLGINKMINCYSLLTWNNRMHYKDEAKGEMIDVELKAQSAEYKQIWSIFLKDFTRHLTEKKWLDRTNIAMDERSPADMQAALSVLKEAAPELGVSLADNHKSYKEYPWIKDLCVGLESKVDIEDSNNRRAEGLNTTFYVCCSHRFPNVFTFSASSEAVYTAWYAVANNLDGFLRWAYNSWVENPLTDSRFRTWPAGDTYIVYPEARSSIRFERLMEGIQDAEKIRLLRAQYQGENTPESQEKLAALEGAIQVFEQMDPVSDWEQQLKNAKQLLNSK